MSELRPRFDPDSKEQLAKWRARRRLGDALRRALARLFERNLPEAELLAAADAVERYADGLTRYPKLGYALFRDENVNAGDVMAYYDKSPIIGLASPVAGPVIAYMRGDDRVEARVTFGTAHEGAPGCVHGGIVAGVFDEVLSFTQPAKGQPGVTASLTIRYRAPTPLGRELIFEAELDRTEGRKIYAKGRCRAGDVITAEAEALFIRITDERRKTFDDHRAMGNADPA
ncbi:MAG TPA: PaaI family thioesterase [Myxococcota bacterium]|nr:PaaI family thioesterase [Myxococcota bacterium]